MRNHLVTGASARVLVNKFRHAFAVAAVATTAFAADEKGGWSSGLDVVVEGTTTASGGLQRGESLHGLALGKVAWSQAKNPQRPLSLQVYASALALGGQGPTEKLVGDFQTVSNIEGHHSARLYSWWAQANAAEWSVRAGALLADEEFTGTAAGGNLLNAAFGWPTFLSANTINTGPAFYVAAPGIRVERSFGDGAAWRTGIYDGDSFDSPTGAPHATRHGVHYRVGGAQGWFALTEVSANTAEDGPRLKVGAWLHTADFDDTLLDASGRRFALSGAAPRRHGRNYGGYGVIEQTLAGKTGAAGNVEVFARGGAAPSNRNMLGWAVDTGVAFTGLIPARPADVLTFGVAHSQFSSRFADHARATDPASPRPDFEQTFEASYRLAAFERFVFQPDVQYIRHPGGSTALRNALAFTLRVTASF